MLSLATERRIADMLDAGKSQAFIARKCKVSLCTVFAIRTGKRARHLARVAPEIEFRELKTPRVCVRCSIKAGHQVYVAVSPCPACLARRQS